MPQFPSTWEFHKVPSALISTSGAITIPAPNGSIARVITHIFADFLNVRGDGANVALTLQVSDSLLPGNIFEIQLVTNGPAAGYDRWTFDDDVNLQGFPGAALTIGFSAGGVGNCYETIRAVGYDL